MNIYKIGVIQSPLYEQAHFFEDVLRLALPTKDQELINGVYQTGVAYFKKENERLMSIGDNHHSLLRAAGLAELVGDTFAAVLLSTEDQKSWFELISRTKNQK